MNTETFIPGKDAWIASEVNVTSPPLKKNPPKKSSPCKTKSNSDSPQKPESPRDTDLLLADTMDAELFHTSRDECYATVLFNGHNETYKLDSRAFEKWLQHKFYETTGKAIRKQSLQDAISQLQAVALFGKRGENKAVRREVQVRVAGDDQKIYLDLCDKDWQVIEVDSEGWRIANNPSCKFIRKPGTLPLPEPISGGRLADLKSLVKCSDDDFKKIVGFLLNALRPGDYPYPLLEIGGEQGSSKSILTEFLKTLIDPNQAPTNCAPKDREAIGVCAANERVLAYDNLSYLDAELSDALCTTSTGGNLKPRALYTNSEQVVLPVHNPVIMNGISELATKSDLQQRTYKIFLPHIPEDKRLPLTLVRKMFHEMYAGVLGRLLDCLSIALKNLGKTQPAKLPRLADATNFVSAAEPALVTETGLNWHEGDFLKLMLDDAKEQAEDFIQTDELARTIKAIVDKAEQNMFQGSNKEFLDKLNGEAKLNPIPKWWPNHKTLRSHLRRIAPVLRLNGIECEYDLRTSKERSYKISKLAVSEKEDGMTDPSKILSSICHAGNLSGTSAYGRDDRMTECLPKLEEEDREEFNF